MTTYIDDMMDKKDSMGSLKRIKKNIENSYQYFKANYDRFIKFRNFLYISSMDDAAKSVQNELQSNSLEFNTIEAYVSRLCGEFTQNEPEMIISTADDFDSSDAMNAEQQSELIEVLEGYTRHILYESKKVGTEYNIYRDTLSGGYSSLKVYTRYTGEKSFKQEPVIQQTFDQTLVGFDTLATKPDKSDGDFCFELVPKRVEDFLEEFPDADIAELNFQGGGFVRENNSFVNYNWSYSAGRDKIVLVADYYEKDKKYEDLVLLTDGQTMYAGEYKKFKEGWDESMGMMDGQMPQEIMRRPSTRTIIKRYQMIENQILKEEETDYPCLPIKFVDGNSIVSRDTDSGGSFRQMTRPIIYQAEGAQRMKNYAGQKLVNEIENLRPAQIIASLESIPKDYLDGYRMPQNTTTLIYNAFHQGNPGIPLEKPMLMPRNEIPQAIPQTFAMADSLIQNIMGSFDSSMTQLTEAQLSGKAVQEITTMGNAVAKVYLHNYLLGMESAIQMIVDMAPKFIKTPRTLPIRTADGRQGYVDVNKRDGSGVKFDYEPGMLKVKIEPGVSFSVQQTRALSQLTAIGNAFPIIGKFISDTSIDLVLDNLDIRHAETMRARYPQWQEQQAMMQKQAMEMQASQPRTDMLAMQIADKQVMAEYEIGQAKIEQKRQEEEAKTILKIAELQMEDKKLNVEIGRIEAELLMDEQRLGVELQKADDERVTKVLDAALKQSDHIHDVSEKQMRMTMEELLSDREHEHWEAEQEVAKLMAARAPKGE
jgi:hypothetical protein